MEERIETTDLTSEQQTTPSKCEGLGASMAVELVIGFWFGIGVVLAVKMVNSLDYCIEPKIRLLPIKWQNKLRYNK